MPVRFVLRRLLIAAGQIVVLLLLVFCLALLLPGDAADARGGDYLSGEQRAETRERLGLDASAGTQFLRWAAAAASGDFGTSYATGQPVTELITQPFAVTGIMALLTMLVLVPIAAAAGFAAGLHPGSARDRTISTVAVFLDSIPDFVLAVLLVAWLAVGLGWFPATFLGVTPATLLAEPVHLVLPLFVMVVRVAAPLIRLIRAGVVTVMHQPYIQQAIRLSVPRGSLLLRHVAPNALAPAMQELGRTGDGLLSGVLIVEAVFVLPGIASLLIDAIGNRDHPVVLAVVLLTGLIAIVVNLLIDLVGQRMVPTGTNG